MPSPDRQSVITRLRAAGCVFAEDEADLLIAEAATPAQLDAMVRRRAAGVPLEYVLGWAAFRGLRIAVDPGVFVPRRRTEFLVDLAADLAAEPARRPARPADPQVVVDLCCGSGAVGAALGAAVGPLELHAADIDPAAVRCARRNLAALGGQVHQGDLYRALPTTLRGRVDVLVANAPYVPTGAVGLLPPEAREHEARVALDGGADGLDVLRRVVAEAPAWLAPYGRLVVECSERQAGPLLDVARETGLTAEVMRCDDRDATALVAAPPGPQGAGRREARIA